MAARPKPDPRSPHGDRRALDEKFVAAIRALRHRCAALERRLADTEARLADLEPAADDTLRRT